MVPEQLRIFAGPSILLNCDIRKPENSLWYQSSLIYLHAQPCYWNVTSENQRTPYGIRAASYICRPNHVTELWRQKVRELLMVSEQKHIFAGPSMLLNCDVRKAENSLWYQSSSIYLQAHPYYW